VWRVSGKFSEFKKKEKGKQKEKKNTKKGKKKKDCKGKNFLKI
jgi:hypothetical protein